LEDTIEIKRAPLFQLSVSNDPSKSIFLEEEIGTSDAIKRIGEWLFPSQEGLCFKLSKQVIGGIKQELMDLKEFSNYCIQPEVTIQKQHSYSIFWRIFWKWRLLHRKEAKWYN
jgi:hypothetical protein